MQMDGALQNQEQDTNMLTTEFYIHLQIHNLKPRL